MHTCDNAVNGPTHIPVLAETAVDLLACLPGKVAVDATVGGGGHASLILEGIGPTGRLIGIDWDQRAIERAGERLQSYSNVILIRDNFRNLTHILEDSGQAKIDALLFDLGLSSFQIDDPTRGFSFRTESTLDMRMDARLTKTATDIVNSYSQKEIARILRMYGEERNAGKIAAALVRRRSRKPIRTTTELADIARACAPRTKRPPIIDPATRTFQALRIEVNMELDNLKATLDDGIKALNPGGRICIISFHSLEDRIVKRAFARAARGCTCPPELPVCACGNKPTLRILTQKPIRPSEEEISANPRCRSARLRAAEKIAPESVP